MDENKHQSDIKIEFQQYYQEIIKPQLLLWEKKRLKYLKIFMAISGFVVIWVCILGVNFNGKASQILNTWGLFICLGILLMFSPLFLFYQRSKESILPLIINFFGNFTYQYRPQMPIEILQQSKIIPKDEILAGDDSFYGEYNGIKVKIMEYVSHKCASEIASNKKNTAEYKKNYGLLLLADMNKNFKGQTIVVKDKGVLNKFIRYKNLERVQLEDTIFEKEFEVYGDDQIEARYILTTAMIEQMLKLRSFFAQISFSFFAGKILINIKTKKNYFECTNIFHSFIKEKRTEQIFEQISALFSIVNIMQLDQKKLL